jgi:hypothetical protein
MNIKRFLAVWKRVCYILSIFLNPPPESELAGGFLFCVKNEAGAAKGQSPKHFPDREENDGRF